MYLDIKTIYTRKHFMVIPSWDKTLKIGTDHAAVCQYFHKATIKELFAAYLNYYEVRKKDTTIDTSVEKIAQLVERDKIQVLKDIDALYEHYVETYPENLI